MDPISNLREQLELSRDIIALVNGTHERGMTEEERAKNESRGERLAWAVLALDEWRRNGGSDPYQNAHQGDNKN
jgi:hypothetical protein